MGKISIIFLTLVLLVGEFFPKANAKVFYEENLKTHLRWALSIPKDQVHIAKNQNVIRIQTLNLTLYKKMVEDIRKQSLNKKYVASVSYDQKGFPENPAQIKIQLKDDSIELFNFYQNAEKRYVLDFWINEDVLNERAAALNKLKKPKILKVKPLPKVKKVKKAKASVTSKVVQAPGPKKIFRLDDDIINISKVPFRVRNVGYRDFRYGAAFIWNYDPHVPTVQQDINLTRKTPTYFYPIKDREFVNDDKEAHMQLSINLFKKEKWGKMAKSIELYEKKYGTDKNKDLNDYLRVNSILKKNLNEKNKGLATSAINMMENIISRTDNYLMQKALLRYIVQYLRNNEEHINVLKHSKKLFVLSKKNFDKEITEFSALLILDSLAHLKQNQKIKIFVEDIKDQGMLQGQKDLAYLTYSYLSLNETQEVIKLYEKYKAGLVKPIHPSILFNVAEAYFRESQFNTAIKLFDEFASDYSYISQASHARLRIALAYEILSKDHKKVLSLYKNAIDRSPVAAVRYEAKLRYVGMTLARKYNPTPKDKEAKIFFDRSPDEERSFDKNLRNLLWITRLRTFINDNKFEEALAYLTSLPLDSFSPVARRVFQGDGAEVVYGLIKQNYDVKNYARAVKIWEVYKDKYESKVAKNPYMNFIISDAFMKLGLYKSFDKTVQRLQKLSGLVHRSFPVWVERENIQISSLVNELTLLRSISSSEWDKALATINNNKNSIRKEVYYRGYIAFQQNKYTQAKKYYEKVLTSQKHRGDLSKAEVANVVLHFVESLYKLDHKDFRKAVLAIQNDMGAVENDIIINPAMEKIRYLYIEHLAAQKKLNSNELLGKTNRFVEKYTKSEYLWRVRYIRGIALISGIDLEKGKNQLREILGNKEVPEEIRDLARSELSVLELNNNL